MFKMTLHKKTTKANSLYTIGFYTAVVTAALTLISFIIAFLSPPVTGPFCQASCLEYPFTDIVSRFPRDYIWMYPAILLNISFVVLVGLLYQMTPKKKRLFSLLGFSFGLMAAFVLIIDYFVQIAVIQPSLLQGETVGIALLTQYNPHGIFIALEEIGYLLMSLALLCMVPLFSNGNKLKNALKWVLISNFALTMIALVFICLFFGIEREYRFEVAAISINWTALLITSTLLSILFGKALKIGRRKKVQAPPIIEPSKK